MTTALDHRYPTVQGEFEQEDEFEFEFEAEAQVERELEEEDEGESFVNPIQRIYRDAELMAHLSRRASEAEGEDEAEAFIGALVPIAARLIPRAAALLSRNAPALIRGATRIAQQLRADPSTRRLVRAIPVVLQRTAQSLADQSASGRPMTADRALKTLATMTGRVLATPASRRRAVGAVDIFDRRWHRRATRSATFDGPLAGGPAYGQPARRRPVRRRQGPPSAAVRRGRRRR
jgi:hypothetical protein